MLGFEAIDFCFENPMGLPGNNWRLPSIKELRTLVRGCPATELGGTCGIEDDTCLGESCWSSSCNGCPGVTGPADGCFWPNELQGDCAEYWSASMVEDGPLTAWSVYFGTADIRDRYVHGYSLHARCVR
jgi:hypothetical protein